MKYSFQYEQAPAFCSVTKNSHIRTTDSTVIGLHSMIDMRIQVIMQYITGVTGHMCHVANLYNNKRLYTTAAVTVYQTESSGVAYRDHATLRVTKYFPKSLKITRNDTIEYGVCKSLFVCHLNYVCITYRL